MAVLADVSHDGFVADVIRAQPPLERLVMRRVRGTRFALILFDFVGFQGNGQEDIRANVVGCGFRRSCVSASGGLARYPAIAMTFKLRFIL